MMCMCPIFFVAMYRFYMEGKCFDLLLQRLVSDNKLIKLVFSFLYFWVRKGEYKVLKKKNRDKKIEEIVMLFSSCKSNYLHLKSSKSL